MENQREQGRENNQMASGIIRKRNFRRCQICILPAKEVKSIENEMRDFELFQKQLDMDK